MDFSHITPSPIQPVEDKWLREKKISLFIKRDDLLHPEMSGNKFRKLKYNLIEVKKKRYDTILTFGGAYSNHLYAVAAAGEAYGLKTIGIVRGERPEPLNPTLRFAENKKMELHFISRTQYRSKYDEAFIGGLQDRFGRFYLLPEGGTNTEAVRGCTEIIDEIDVDFDYITCACGTGGTLSGLIAGLDGRKNMIGIPVLKGGEYLKNEIQHLVRDYNGKIYLNWYLETGYHFGGFARFTDELIDFINDFKHRHKIQLDPIYTGKIMFGVFDLIRKGYFSEGSRIIAIHTGGIQGIAGFNQRFGHLIR